jgi:hypothetical protein
MENKEVTIATIPSEEHFLLSQGGKLQGKNHGMTSLPPRRGRITKEILASIFVSLKPLKRSSSDAGKS